MLCCHSDKVFDQGLARVREYLASSTADASSCLVCLAVLQPREAVWHCMDGCYEVMHLVCAQVCAFKGGLLKIPEGMPQGNLTCCLFKIMLASVGL